MKKLFIAACLLSIFTLNAKISHATDDVDFMPEAGSLFVSPPIFWNKLGSNEQIMNSSIGPGGIITGTVSYSNCMLGKGISIEGSGSSVVFPGAITDLNNATLEFWWKPGFYSVDTGTYTLFGLEGVNTGQISTISLMYAQCKLLVAVNGISIIVLYDYINFDAGRLHHVALVPELNNPLKPYIRLYFDGQEINWTSNLSGGDMFNLPNNIDLKLTGNIVGNSGVIDNIRYYNYKKYSFNEVAVQPVEYVNTVQKDVTVNISWRMPEEGSLARVVVVKKKDSYPKSIDDGEIIFDGLGTYVVDTNIKPGVTYCYAVTVYNADNIFSYSTYAVSTINQSDLSEAYAYPVPFKPNSGNADTGTEAGGITFTKLVTPCKISVYSMSGEHVKEKIVEEGNSWNWDVRNDGGEKVASGLYFYLIHNEYGKKKGKLIVIR